jgi:hypothetical protein
METSNSPFSPVPSALCLGAMLIYRPVWTVLVLCVGGRSGCEGARRAAENQDQVGEGPQRGAFLGGYVPCAPAQVPAAYTPHTTYPIPQLSHIKSLSIFGALLLSKQKPKTTLRIVRLLLHKRAVDAFLAAWATMLTGPPAPPARLLPGVP